MVTHTLKEKMCKKAFPLHFLLGEGNKKSYSEAVKSYRESKASCLRCWRKKNKSIPLHLSFLSPFFFLPSFFSFSFFLVSWRKWMGCAMVHAWWPEETLVGFCSFTSRVLGIKLGFSVLEATVFTHSGHQPYTHGISNCKQWWPEWWITTIIYFFLKKSIKLLVEAFKECMSRRMVTGYARKCGAPWSL